MTILRYTALACTLVPGILPASGAAGLRRLTHSQYNNTVRDLLGDQTRPADRFPQEDFVHGFKNQGPQDVPPLLAEAYNTAAERLARNAFPGGEDVNHLLPCKPRSPADAGCAASFVRRLGARAFRRPLTAAEVGRYTSVLLREASRTGDFHKGAQLAIEGMLQSPKFLFRLEEGAYQTASRLSFFLWDTMPDEILWREAASGALANPDGIERSVRRMMADPRARDAVNEFASQWLRFDLALNAVKDRTLYPQFTPELAVAMTQETSRLFDDLVWGDGNFMDFFRAGYSFLNSDLAALYGVPPPANEFDKVQFSPGSERAGILGQALFLTLTSKPGETSPTVRGYFIRSQFLCQEIPDPPPGTNSNLPPVTSERPQTNRERLKEHMINRTCSGCHTLMDPIGLGFERFDAIGRYRDKFTLTFLPEHHGAGRNRKPVTVELDLDTTGVVLGMANSAFRSVKELGAILAQSRECQSCVVKQLFRYGAGRRENDADTKTLERAGKVFEASGFRLKELIMLLAKELAEGNR
jgi:hypothetical protein